MKRILTLLIAISVAGTTYTQEVQKCCGTSSSTFLLGSTNYARHTQCLYAPGDFTGATSGSIIRLYYRYGTSGVANGNTLGDLSISLRQTTATAFSGVQFLTGLQSVLDATSLSIAPGQSGNWFSIELDTPFLYDPTQSLVVDIRFENSANTAFGTYATSGNTGRKIMSDSTASPTGETWDTLQDLGFDLDDGAGVSQRVLTDVMLYPNPAEARSELMWTMPLAQGGFITLSDLSGRTMMTSPVAAGLTRTSLDLTSMAKGMYLLQLRDATGLLYSERLGRE
ncbi:MAG: T9SS type A sorting domain-containing protein [Flavobacteriales bacterium]